MYRGIRLVLSMSKDHTGKEQGQTIVLAFARLAQWDGQPTRFPLPAFLSVFQR